MVRSGHQGVGKEKVLRFVLLILLPALPSCQGTVIRPGELVIQADGHITSLPKTTKRQKLCRFVSDRFVINLRIFYRTRFSPPG